MDALASAYSESGSATPRIKWIMVLSKELVEIHHNLTGELSSADWALINWVTCQDGQQSQKVY